MSTVLVSRNVKVGRRRTSLKLEATMWDGLGEIAVRENVSVHDLCTLIDARLQRWNAEHPARKGEPKRTLSGAVRVFIFSYYRRAATDEGHLAAGHGRGHPLVGTPFEGLVATDS